jgi:transcriptional antiterminator RfaH
MPYWAAARLQPQRERLALDCLARAGFETYLPRVRKPRTIRGRKVEATAPLFPGYVFLQIELQCHAARWRPGILGPVVDGTTKPPKVPDLVIGELRGRERNGVIRLPPKPPAMFLQVGDRVRSIPVRCAA